MVHYQGKTLNWLCSKNISLIALVSILPSICRRDLLKIFEDQLKLESIETTGGLFLEISTSPDEKR
jgi:hypothetical protein